MDNYATVLTKKFVSWKRTISFTIKLYVDKF